MPELARFLAMPYREYSEVEQQEKAQGIERFVVA